jgi:hypothetical protein
MITKEQYIEFLISTPINYTCTHLADHISGISHDSITDFLKSQRLTAASVWAQALTLIHNTEDSFLIVDDSVQEKPYARAIEPFYPHYSGNKHVVIRGLILSILCIVQETAIIIRLTIAFLHQNMKKPPRTIIFWQC